MLHHPNIIEYFDSFAHDKSMMIVMEYAAGGTLFDLLESRVEQQVNKKFDQIIKPLFRFYFNIRRKHPFFIELILFLKLDVVS